MGVNSKFKIQNLNCPLLFTLCSLLIFIYGCSSSLKQYIRPNINIGNIKTIAVLPFENLTQDRHADEKIRRIVIIELLSRNIDVIEPGEVTKVLRELRLRTLASISNSDIKYIGETLGVDAVMKGSIGTFKISRGISVSYPEVSIHLMLLEATSGNIIWSVWHTAGGASFWTRHFGAEGITLDEAAKKVVKEAIDTLF
jgi:TolB-like protein